MSKLFDLSQAPQRIAEHWNKGVAAMIGAEMHLNKHPNDLLGAVTAGLEFQHATQGNFSPYNLTKWERSIRSYVPFAKSFLLMKGAVIQSYAQIAQHMINSANHPAKMKAWMPVLTYLASSLVLTGITGAPITGDIYDMLETYYNVSRKSADELSAVDETFSDRISRMFMENAQAMGYNPKPAKELWDLVQAGLNSKLTGRNFAQSNRLSGLLTDFWNPSDAPGASTIKSIGTLWDALTGAGPSDAVTITRALNVQAGRTVRALDQLAKGYKTAKGGYKIDDVYTPGQAFMDVVLPSDLREVMYGTNKRDGGGRIYYPLEAKKYLDRLKYSGVKITDEYKNLFKQPMRGYDTPIYNADKVNTLRNLVIFNYQRMKPAEEKALQRWEKIRNIHGIEDALTAIATQGQPGSRLSTEPMDIRSKAIDRIKKYFVANAVQLSYMQMFPGIEPPEYKYAGQDPLYPLMQWLDGLS